MKVVILAGGFGTRISEYTKFIPKPMIRIKGLPILVHIMKHYSKFGFNEFYIALGYKGNVIKNYFKNKKFNWKINLVDTGKNTMTGGRLKRLKKYESSNAVEQLPVIWDKAINDKIYDPYGNCWIDFTSSIFVSRARIFLPII